MSKILQGKYLAEDQIVVELRRLGVGYLSCTGTPTERGPWQPDELLADLIRQPSSRVRTALIPLLIAHPELQTAIPQSRSSLRGPRRKRLELFYTAAVFLQRKHQRQLVEMQGEAFGELEDLFSKSLCIPPNLSPDESLAQLAIRHREISGRSVNWAGTYENALQHWLRYREKERSWNLSI